MARFAAVHTLILSLVPLKVRKSNTSSYSILPNGVISDKSSSVLAVTLSSSNINGLSYDCCHDSSYPMDPMELHNPSIWFLLFLLTALPRGSPGAEVSVLHSLEDPLVK